MAKDPKTVPALPIPSPKGAVWPTFSVSTQERQAIMIGNLKSVNLQRTGTLPSVPPQYIQLSSSSATRSSASSGNGTSVLSQNPPTIPGMGTPVRSSLPGAPVSPNPLKTTVLSSVSTNSPPAQPTAPPMTLSPMPTTKRNKPGPNMLVRSSGDNSAPSLPPTTRAFLCGATGKQQQTVQLSGGPVRTSGNTASIASVFPRVTSGTTPCSTTSVRAHTLATVSLVIACFSLAGVTITFFVALTSNTLSIVATILIVLAVVAFFCSIPVLRHAGEKDRSKVFATWGLVLSIVAVLVEIAYLIKFFH